MINYLHLQSQAYNYKIIACKLVILFSTPTNMLILTHSGKLVNITYWLHLHHSAIAVGFLVGNCLLVTCWGEWWPFEEGDIRTLQGRIKLLAFKELYAQRMHVIWQALHLLYAFD